MAPPPPPPIPGRLVRLLGRAAQQMIAAGDDPYLGSYDTCRQLGEFIAAGAAQLASGDCPASGSCG